MNIVSWNCKNFKTNSTWLNAMFCDVDIFLLQETWLYNFEQNLIEKCFPDYFCVSISSMPESCVPKKGRPFGGSAILVHNKFGDSLVLVNNSDPRLLCLKMKTHFGELLVINVYFPCNTRQNEKLITSYISKLENIISDHNGPVLVAGDFNITPASQKYKELMSMFADHSLWSEDEKYLQSNAYTFVSDANDCKSWLDHCFATKGIVNGVSLPHVTSASDHLPVLISLEAIVNVNMEANSAKSNGAKHKVNWHKATPKNLENYSKSVWEKIMTVNWSMCNVENCCNLQHRISIDQATETLISILQCSAKDVLAGKKHGRPKNFCVNGWNVLVKENYDNYRNAYIAWVSSSKCDHRLHDNMQYLRKKFKSSLKFCKKSANRRLSEQIALSYEGKCFQKFWTHVKSCDGSKQEVATEILDGISSECDIREHWAKLYGDLFCAGHGNEKLAYVQNYIDKNSSYGEINLQKDLIIDIVHSLKNNKAVGSDGLQAEHLKLAIESVAIPLTNLLNSMIAHSYIPQEVMKVDILPIVKKKGLDPSKSSNYRPIAIASILSKVLEMAILRLCEKKLQTSNNQFGYKKGVGTELAVYALKQVTHHYVRNGCPTYLCFMDASKAFDKVNHFLLLSKLCDRGIPAIFVKLLLFWFRTQEFVVKWKGVASRPFPVLNSVRQGGILSAYFFAVYLDELSIKLTNTKVGCYVGDLVFNHIIYADDICLMTTSIKALQILLKVCEKYAAEHDLTFNPSKTVCQCFADYSYDETRPLIRLCGKILQWKDTVRYLGYDINCRNRDAEEMFRRRRELYSRANQLKSRFSMCNNNVKQYLFKTYFSTVYCNSLWAPVKRDMWEKLKVAYNDSFRLIFNLSRRCSASQMFVQNRINDFNAMRRASVYSLLNRIAQSDNIIIQTITSSKMFTCSSLSKLWRELLFNVKV